MEVVLKCHCFQFFELFECGNMQMSYCRVITQSFSLFYTTPSVQLYDVYRNYSLWGEANAPA